MLQILLVQSLFSYMMAMLQSGRGSTDLISKYATVFVIKFFFSSMAGMLV